MGEVMENLLDEINPQIKPRKTFDDIYLGKSMQYQEFSHIKYPDYHSIFGNRKLVEVKNDDKYEESDNFIHNNLKVYLNQNINYTFKKNEGGILKKNEENSKSQTKFTN